MSKQILIVSSGPRKGGNSDTLCDQFRKGAGAWQLGDIQGNPGMQEAYRMGKNVC